MKKTVWITIILVTVAVGAIVGRGCMQGAGVRKRLAAYKADLKAKGEKISAADLGYPRPVEPNQDLALLVAAVDQIESLKIDRDLLRSMNFVAAGRAQVGWEMAHPPKLLLRGTKTNELRVSWDDLSAQFETAASKFHELRAAVESPPLYFYCSPSNWFQSQPKPPFVKMRNGAQFLATDALLALHARDLARTQADIHALTQLAQTYRDDPTLVAQMIRVAIAGLGLSVTWEALQSPDCSEEFLAALQRDWEAVELAGAVVQAAEGERAFGEYLFKDLQAGITGRSNNLFNTGSAVPRPTLFQKLVGLSVEADELFFLEQYQATLNSLRKFPDGPGPVISKELKGHYAEVQLKFTQPFGGYRHFVSGLIIPNLGKAYETCIRTETQRRLTLAAIALERYRLGRGQLPPELSALVPEFLATVPLDPMSAKPLRYQLKPEGSILLYSVGEDQNDDGGNPALQNPTNKFDLWSGKDAVWPAAVRD